MRKLILGVAFSALCSGIAIGTGLSALVAGMVGIATTPTNLTWVTLILGGGLGAIAALAWPLYSARAERLLIQVGRFVTGNKTLGAARLLHLAREAEPTIGTARPPSPAIERDRWVLLEDAARWLYDNAGPNFKRYIVLQEKNGGASIIDYAKSAFIAAISQREIVARGRRGEGLAHELVTFDALTKYILHEGNILFSNAQRIEWIDVQIARSDLEKVRDGAEASQLRGCR